MAKDQKQYLWAFSPVAPKQAWRTLGRALYGATGTTLWLVDRSTLVSPTEYGDGRFTFDHADVWYLPVDKILIAYGEELLERAGLEGLTDEEIDEVAVYGGRIEGISADVLRDLRGHGRYGWDLPRAVDEVIDEIAETEHEYRELISDLEDRLMEAFEMVEEEWV